MGKYSKKIRRLSFVLALSLVFDFIGLPMTAYGVEEPEIALVEIDMDKIDLVDEVTEFEQTADSKSVSTISGNAGNTTATYDFKNIESAIKELKEVIGTKGDAAVTEVYSINNKLKDCYYKPRLEEIYMLEEYVMLEGDMASAYTGFFDLTADSPNTGNEECRELEILGYDFLLSNEDYDGSSYTATRVNGAIDKRTAIMDIYKALGIEIQQIQLYYNREEKAEMINSPAAKNLSWLVNDINAERGRTDAFITRTKPEYYAAKAKSDLHWNDADVSASEVITLGEFIVRVADMMDLYGEPVISQAEMNTLIQVFGGNIPASLSGGQLDAYIYLRSRGILTDDYQVFSSALTFRQMIEILMRVKDVDSRQNLKDMQITMAISDTLKNAGFFPKTVTVTEGSEAIQIVEDYDYTDVTVYDYFINLGNAGFSDSRAYIPIDLVKPQSSSGLYGVSVQGYETIRGIKYMHVKINVASATEYFNSVKAVTGKDNAFILVDGSDPDKRVVFEQGGGVYTIDSAINGVYTTNRVNFDGTGNSWAGYVDAERSRAGADTGSNLLARVIDFFRPMVTKAADPSTDPVVELTIFNWSNVDQDPSVNGQRQLDIYRQIYVDIAADTAILKMQKSYVDTFRQNIIRKQGSSTGTMRTVQSIANVSGDTLIPVEDLIGWGLIYEPDVWDFSSGILTLDTKYGRVVLNQNMGTVVAGTTLYKLALGTQLFGLDSNRELMIDFRAVYGWSANIADITVTGTSTGYSIGVAEFDENNKAVPLQKRDITINKIFDNDSNSRGRNGMFTPANVISAEPGYLMTSNYQFANWIIIDSYNQTENALYVFYNRKAFTNSGLMPPDDTEAVAEVEKFMVYKAISDNDWVVRKFRLDLLPHNEAGSVTYTEQYGYIYNVPVVDKSDDLVAGYLQGDYMLPLYFDAGQANGGNTNCRNINVNIWGSLPYGVRYYGEDRSHGQPVRWMVDWKGNGSSATGTLNHAEVTATPACVQSLFGGSALDYADVNSYQALITAAQSNSYTAMYFGTNKVSPTSSGNAVRLEIPNTGFKSAYYTGSYVCEHNLDDSTKFYEMAKWRGSGTDKNYYSRYVHFGSILEEKTVEEIQQDADDAQRNPVTIYVDEYEDSFGGFDDFSLGYLLGKVDTVSYWVLFLAVKILPMIMIIALTLIMGMSFMSDNRIVQRIVDKTFDPVKLLTFGHKTFAGMTKKQSLVTLLMGYLVFVLIADGNILKVIMFMARLIDTFAGALRNM